MNVNVQGSETRVKLTKSECKKLRDAHAVFQQFRRITGIGDKVTFDEFVSRIDADGKYQEPQGA